MSRTHRGHRSPYGEERQLVQATATFESIRGDDDGDGKELINHLDLFYFKQGEVLADPYGQGSFQRITPASFRLE